MEDCKTCQGSGQIVLTCGVCIGNGIHREGWAPRNGNIDALEVLWKVCHWDLTDEKRKELIRLAAVLIGAERESYAEELKESKVEAEKLSYEAGLSVGESLKEIADLKNLVAKLREEIRILKIGPVSGVKIQVSTPRQPGDLAQRLGRLTPEEFKGLLKK